MTGMLRHSVRGKALHPADSGWLLQSAVRLVTTPLKKRKGVASSELEVAWPAAHLDTKRGSQLRSRFLCSFEVCAVTSAALCVSGVT